MTQRTGALKTTILGGAIFMIPFVILLAVAGKAYVLMQTIATPITNPSASSASAWWQ